MQARGAKQLSYCNSVFEALCQLTDAKDPLLPAEVREWLEDLDGIQLTVPGVRRPRTLLEAGCPKQGLVMLGLAYLLKGYANLIT